MTEFPCLEEGSGDEVGSAKLLSQRCTVLTMGRTCPLRLDESICSRPSTGRQTDARRMTIHR